MEGRVKRNSVDLRIEALAPDEGGRLRAIRLRALADAPDAFGGTLEEAVRRSPEGWSKQLRELPTFVAVHHGLDVGMVRCARDSRAGTAWLLSMWVGSEVRRQGVGSMLVDAVVHWARSNGMARLLLDVADHNAPAIALYATKGFVPNGVVSHLPPPRQHIREHQRELVLA
jgi:GNAT superfamily N-acetyltransferase